MPGATLAVEDNYALTPTQKGMLFHRLLDERSGVDVQQLVLTNPAQQDREAWRRLIARHPVLRTSFRWEGLDEPSQEVWAEVALPWSESQRELGDFLREDRARGFALDAPPLLRLTWLARERKLVWTFHQALLDSTSVALLLEELERGSTSNSTHQARPFREFVQWVQERESSEGFWREQLRGFTAPTPLPWSRPAGSGFGEIAIDHAASEEQVLAAWSQLLARHSGETDVVFGVAKSRRPPGHERSIGMFINTIPFRPRTATPAALAPHEHTPLVNIQRWSEVRGASLFDTLVIFDETDVRLIERTSYPLALTVYRDSMKLAYDRTRIDDAAARRLAGHLVMLLTTGTMLTEAERRQILVEWNDTRREVDLTGSIHELFEAQVAATPDRIALNGLTYRELNARADGIAARLQDLGVGPDTLVGILMERSPDLVAALLGILKAGGAYVPLDPTYPVDRLAYMLDDSAAPVLVTQTSLATLIPTNAAVLSIDAPSAGASGAPSASGAPASSRPLRWHPAGRTGENRRQDASGAAGWKPALRASSENLAYVIYTSGSTGKPKGVQLPHRAVLNFLATMRERPGLTADDALLAVTTLSFDIAGLELWLPLTTGARVELASHEVAADGRRLVEALASSGATVMQATPATWRMLLEAGWKGDPNLKILCGGEAMSRDLADRLLPLCGSLWNLYGPTETTIWSTVERVERPGDGATIPIGRPIANTEIYLLDPALEPVPAGVAGELHIGGAGLARGYLNRPELTAERFIPWDGKRLYKTGDAARYLPDGRIEYLNRLDNQVKVRGYRIELGEIEAALRKHPAIADAVVTASNALTAYFISEQRPSAGELREHLKKSLPDYMVPTLFMQLDAFPLTPNGKVDRRALPSPERALRDEQAFVPPRDELETRLAKLWADVLRVPKVGVTDSFFELGGDSLLALRLFIRIEEAFGRQLPLATIIQASTIEALAATLRDDGSSLPLTPLVTIQANGTKPPFFCVHGVGGNAVGFHALARHLGRRQPFHALQSRGLDGVEEPLTHIEEMAALYIDEIRKVQPEGPYYLGGLSFGGLVAFEMAQQLRRQNQKVALIALFDTAPVGYSRVSPKSATRDFDESLTKRMRIHADVLLRGPNRLQYLGKRIRRLWRRAVYRTWQTAFAIFDRFKRPLPRALRDVQQANYLALRRYHPRVYSGKVVFFYAEREPHGFTREKQHGWSVLAAGGVLSEEVPGDHLTMLEEPYVRGLGEKLAKHLG
jgi:amino acid adenylation domain-containing protein